MKVNLSRNLAAYLERTISERPLVYLNGPRQTGKSWLIHNFNFPKDKNYLSFDSPLILSGAKTNPIGFVESLPPNKLNVIDEVQMAPEIFLPLKSAIDKNRMSGISSGQFLLTGSANLMAIPKLAEALVGRMSIITLYPVSASEYKQTNTNFIERLFKEELIYREYEDYDLVNIIANSTYPELASQAVPLQPTLGFSEYGADERINRVQWFGDYLTTIFQRDIKTISNIRNPENLIRLLSVFTMRVGSQVNNASMSAEVELDINTYNKYKQFLINAFLIYELKPWSKPNRTNIRFSSRAKMFFIDTNLLLYVMQRELRDVYQNDGPTMGHILENFIATEILKNSSSLPDIRLSHFRTYDNKEVDFVIEQYNGDTLGIEVKMNQTLDARDFSGLKVLQNLVGEKFKKGIVLYTGNRIVSFGENMWAVPICYLWR